MADRMVEEIKRKKLSAVSNQLSAGHSQAGTPVPRDTTPRVREG